MKFQNYITEGKKTKVVIDKTEAYPVYSIHKPIDDWDVPESIVEVDEKLLKEYERVMKDYHKIQEKLKKEYKGY